MTPAPSRDARAIAHWLFAVAALVLLMIAVGGITRLTESGLSITEWKPVTGAIPPLDDAAWQAAFEAYQRVPQYQAIHADMTLHQFKVIYFWEWAHRLLGRIIGLAFALPLAWFAIRRRVPAGYMPRLIALLALGGLQGAVGWWMVTSGLFQGTAVSHLRLAIHLLLALFIMGGLIWTALDLLHGGRARLTAIGLVTLAVLGIQILFGAWTSGLRAGLAARDWPLMNGSFLPQGIGWLDPAWRTFAHDPFLVHWVHRWWAWVAVTCMVWLARRIRRSRRRASIAIHSAFGTQILLGIATVMTGVLLPIAVLHQLTGALTLAAVVWGAHIAGRQPPHSPPVT